LRSWAIDIVAELGIRHAHRGIKHFGELRNQAIHPFLARAIACHSHKRTRLDHQSSVRPSGGHSFLEPAAEAVDSLIPRETHDIARDAVDARDPVVRLGTRLQSQPLSLSEVSGKPPHPSNGLLYLAPLG
jgi:hypothetical protein